MSTQRVSIYHRRRQRFAWKANSSMVASADILRTKQMRVFSVILEGSGFCIPAIEGDEPIIGFYTTRRVRAADPAAAAETAKAKVLKEWESGEYAAVNTGGLPDLKIDRVDELRGFAKIFSTAPTKGYSFYSDSDEEIG